MNQGSDTAYDPDTEMRAAAFGIRAVARIIDTLVGWLSMMIGVAIATVLHMIVTGGPGPRDGHLPWLISLTASVAYQTCSEGLGGASLGKLLCGLRVLGEDDRPCDLGTAFIRNATYYIDGLLVGYVGYMSMEKSARQQRNGDRWAKTVVVYASSVPERSARSSSLIAAAIFLGFVVAVAVTVVSWLAPVS